MKSIRWLYVLEIIVVLTLAVVLSGCREKDKKEISSHKNILSCTYAGLSERNGRPLVELVFKNNSGKNITSVFGSIRIIDKNGEIIQRTGFTYSRPFEKNEEKIIPAFAYIDIKPNALQILKKASGFVPVSFVLHEIQYKNNESVKY